MVWGEQTIAVVLTFLRIAATAGFVTAGALRLARWRITADARSAYVGAALVLLGGISLPLSQAARVLSQDHPASLLAPLARLVATALVLVLIARALTVRVADPLTLRPGELLVRSAALTAAGFLALTIVWSLWPDALRGGEVVRAVIEAVLVSGWMTLALAAWRVGSHWGTRVAPLLACLGLAEVFRLLAHLQHGQWILAAATLTLLVAGFAVWFALTDLFDAAAGERRRVEALSAALRVAHEATTQHDAWREELTHDVRNALTGLRAALHTLDSYGPQLDEDAAAQLRAAAIDEVGHLEHLVEGADRAEVVAYEAVAVVRSVVSTRRAAGQDVRLRGTAGLVTGRPGDLTTVLQNLLVNASVHAPGSPVTVDMEVHDRRVEVIVSDRGPGIPPDGVDQVFARGAHGPRSTGSGLGLYVARSLMRKQGGDVELRSHVAGTTFAVLLPAVERRASAPLTSQHRRT